MGINADIQKLEPGALVELFELDASGIGGEVLRFHGYMQVGPIFWQGQRYEPWAIQAEGFEQVGEGQQPSPTLRVGNIGQDAQGRPLAGVISSLCVHLDDLVGARVVARRTLGRYLDAANFPEGNPSADPREELPPEIWIVQQKTLETAQVVEFTLASARLQWPEAARPAHHRRRVRVAAQGRLSRPLLRLHRRAHVRPQWQPRHRSHAGPLLGPDVRLQEALR